MGRRRIRKKSQFPNKNPRYTEIKEPGEEVATRTTIVPEKSRRALKRKRLKKRRKKG